MPSDADDLEGTDFQPSSRLPPARSHSKISLTSMSNSKHKHLDDITSDEELGVPIPVKKLSAANGRPPSKRKGKRTAKEKSGSLATGQPVSGDTMELDSPEIITYDQRSSQKELQRQLEEITKQRDALAKHCDMLTKVRQTEAEAALEAFQQAAEAQSSTQEELIRDLTSQLARIKPMLVSGKSTSVHLLTREAAEEEKVILRDEIATLRRQVTVEQDKYARLTNENNMLQSQLDAEIKRSTELHAQTRGVGQVNRLASGPLKSPIRSQAEDDNATKIQLYESLTDLIITSLSMDESSGYKQLTFSFIYTFSDGRHVAFKLQDYREPRSDPGSSPKEWMIFHPLNVDEDIDVDLLKAPFTFQKDQLSLFITTLRDHLARAQQGQRGDESEYDEDIDNSVT